MLNQLKTQVMQYYNKPKNTTATVHMYTHNIHMYVCTYVRTYTHQDDSGVAAILGLAYCRNVHGSTPLTCPSP